MRDVILDTSERVAGRRWRLGCCPRGTDIAGSTKWWILGMCPMVDVKARNRRKESEKVPMQNVITIWLCFPIPFMKFRIKIMMGG